MTPIPKRYKAKDLDGNIVEGWYAVLHLPEFGEHGEVLRYVEKPHLFNDEPSMRSKGGYWHEIQPQTLREIEQQLTLF